MNRRDFFKVLAIGGTAAIAPKIVFAEMLKPLPPAAIVVSEVVRRVSQRLDLIGEPWQVWYAKTIGDTDWDIAILEDQYPDEAALARCEELAEVAFARALKEMKNGTYAK